MIDYKLLQALVAVIQQGGFERAAEKLFITQSAISQRIKQLEGQLGQPVLVRSHPPRATALGQKLHTHWQQVQQLQAGLNLNEQSQCLSIRIAVNADSLATWLPRALVTDHIDNISFDLLVEDQDVALRRMRQGEVMGCVCSDPEPLNGAKVSRLGSMRYRAVASPQFIQRFNIGQLNQTELADVPCLVFNRDDILQHQFIKQMTGAQPSHIHLCPSSEGFVQCALAGIGYGLLPELQISQQLADGSLRDIVPGYFQDVPLFWHHWSTQSPVMVALREKLLAVAAAELQQS